MGNAAQLGSFLLNVLKERLIRVLPGLFMYPQMLALLLDPNVDDAKAARSLIVQELCALLDAEKAATAGDSSMRLVLRDVHWRSQDIARLAMFTVLRESMMESIGPETLYLARHIATKMPDGKAPEDIRQHVRDHQRSQRHRNVKAATVYNLQVRSGVLEERGIRCPNVSAKRVAEESWRSIKHKKPSKSLYAQPPSDYPTYLNDILDGQRSWPSPAVAGQLESYLAWTWLLSVQRDRADDLDVCADSAWWSRLVPAG